MDWTFKRSSQEENFTEFSVKFGHEKVLWVLSSDGRASRLHRESQRFDPVSTQFVKIQDGGKICENFGEIA